MSGSVRHIEQQFWCSQQLPHLEVRTTYNSTQGYKAHSHSALSIGLIEVGTTCLSIKDKKIFLNQGDMVLIQPHAVHACNPVNGNARSYHMLYVDESWCCEALSALYQRQVDQITCTHIRLTDLKIANELSFLINTLLKKTNKTKNNASHIDSLLFDILNLYCAPIFNKTDNNLALQIKQHLLNNMVSPPSNHDISQQLGCSTESVIRNFKRCFGITPKSFLNNSRIEKAKYLLKSGVNIIDVASEVGYSDQSQLHRAFVNYTASTPRQYQQLKSFFDNKS
ncbi:MULTISPECIES: AraC family transcriptional regulator [unclassified Agarivorans]|uniref:AraC family transcriptional regulator n=1 Tax=unclassified Agarivorans TaxID=2636026 RepID=UPI003D7E24C7